MFGKVDFGLQPRKNGASQIIVSQGSFSTKHVSLREKSGKETLVKADSVSTGKVLFDLEKKQVTIASAASSGADVKLRLENDGQLNFQTLFAGESTPEKQIAPGRLRRSGASSAPKGGKTPSKPEPAVKSTQKRRGQQVLFEKDDMPLFPD